MGEARQAMDAVTEAIFQKPEAAARLYAPDAVAITPDQGELTGREQVVQYLTTVRQPLRFRFPGRRASGRLTAAVVGAKEAAIAASMRSHTGEHSESPVACLRAQP
jgi:hypothetical protein